MKDLLNDTFSRCLYPNSIYNGNKAAANLRPNGPAGGIAADGNADARCPSLESGLQRKLELYHALIPRPACRAAWELSESWTLRLAMGAWATWTWRIWFERWDIFYSSHGALARTWVGPGSNLGKQPELSRD